MSSFPSSDGKPPSGMSTKEAVLGLIALISLPAVAVLAAAASWVLWLVLPGVTLAMLYLLVRIHRRVHELQESVDQLEHRLDRVERDEQ